MSLKNKPFKKKKTPLFIHCMLSLKDEHDNSNLWKEDSQNIICHRLTYNRGNFQHQQSICGALLICEYFCVVLLEAKLELEMHGSTVL